MKTRHSSRRRCDGVSRRDFVRIGMLGAGALSLPGLLRAEAAAGTAQGKSAILIYLDGGQSHLESWDLKPDAGDTAGEFKPISTNVPGLQVCEHMPLLAQHADKYCVVRGVEKAIAVHGIGMSYVRSGNRPTPSLKYPDAGSVITKEFESPRGIPPFISLPVSPSNGTTETPGYLGVAYSSFTVDDDPDADDFQVRALNTPSGISALRAQKRMALVEQLDTAYRDLDLANDNVEGMDRFYEQAYDILRSKAIRAAFDLQSERSENRETYGRTNIGQACLLARRLVEAGVRCVTLDFGGWDTHQNNFADMKEKLLPPWDRAVAALLQDLHDRGMLDSTLVWSTGEMGRTPKINDNAGRDHWGNAMSMMLAGAGIRGGQAIGKTDETGSTVVEDGCTPADVAATALHAMGINPQKEYYTSTGRPIRIVRDGTVISKCFATVPESSLR